MILGTITGCVMNIRMIVNGDHSTMDLLVFLFLQVCVLHCFPLSFFGSFMGVLLRKLRRQSRSSPSHPDSQRFGLTCCPQRLGVKGCGTNSSRRQILQCVICLLFSLCAAHFYCDTQSLSRHLVHGAGGSPKCRSIGETLQTRSLYFLLDPF